MAPLTFVDTHNMVAYLSKSDASAGFDQVVDFLNAHTIHYALVVNPTIYVSCIKQFWATATIKKINDVVQLRALIDGKKVVVTDDVIRRYLHLDDADGVECLPNEEIFAELARMGYKKPPSKLTFYMTFFSAQWKFLIHTLVQCLSSERTAWNEFSCSMASAIICLATVDDMSTHNTRYASPALTQKAEEEEEEEVKMPIAYAPPSPTNAPSPLSPINAPSPPSQDPTPTPHATPLQDQPSIPPASPSQEQPTSPDDSTMPLLTPLMETCASLSQKVAELKQAKHTQALEILQLKKRVKKLEKKKRSKFLGFKRLRRGRINQEDVNAASKGVSAAEPTEFDDEEVQERHLYNIRKYQSLKKKPVSVAQARKNMIIYLKNMAGYKMEHFRGMTYDKVRPIFEKEYKKVQTLFKADKDVEEPKKKRVANETLLQESFKKLKAIEVLEIVPMSEFKVEALQVKYPIIDWEIHIEGSRTYWKIIRVGGITYAYQSFEDMLKGFDREDLVAL
nr:hypothetical protein [Tanacetum cinerariifolium]